MERSLEVLFDNITLTASQSRADMFVRRDGEATIESRKVLPSKNHLSTHPRTLATFNHLGKLATLKTVDFN